MRVWDRLDNAAKIFPAASFRHDTNVFRFYCEINEKVDESILQKALNMTIDEFPTYRFIMKRGAFWYYLEQSDIQPVVKKEDKSPCSAIYDRDRKKLLFEVTYFRNRINLEVYHVLTDGTGALEFLKCLVYHYLCLKHKEVSSSIELDYDASNYQQMDDSFQRYYDSSKKKNNKMRFAYRIKGIKTLDNQLNIIEGFMPVKAMLNKAHEYSATLTAFVTALLLTAIYEEMPYRDRKKDVVISIPVNLRKYFDSESARNFFSVIPVTYNFSKQSSEFGEIIKYVNNFLKEELKEEKLKLRINALIGLEKNVILRIVPLFLKNIVLRIAFRISEMTDTSTISNLGQVKMPKELEKYIDHFGMIVATNQTQIGMCSFRDKLAIGFSSSFLNTDIQRRFFRKLSEMKIPVEIVSNQVKE